MHHFETDKIEPAPSTIRLSRSFRARVQVLAYCAAISRVPSGWPLHTEIGNKTVFFQLTKNKEIKKRGVSFSPLSDGKLSRRSRSIYVEPSRTRAGGAALRRPRADGLPIIKALPTHATSLSTTTVRPPEKVPPLYGPSLDHARLPADDKRPSSSGFRARRSAGVTFPPKYAAVVERFAAPSGGEGTASGGRNVDDAAQPILPPRRGAARLREHLWPER